jgi:hypothetical protein
VAAIEQADELFFELKARCLGRQPAAQRPGRLIPVAKLENKVCHGVILFDRPLLTKMP